MTIHERERLATALLREPKQLVLVPGVGHAPPLQDRVPAINRFLDQTLGPVHR